MELNCSICLDSIPLYPNYNLPSDFDLNYFHINFLFAKKYSFHLCDINQFFDLQLANFCGKCLENIVRI